MAASEAASIPLCAPRRARARELSGSLRVTPATPFKAGFRQCSSALIPAEVLPTWAFACRGVAVL